MKTKDPIAENRKWRAKNIEHVREYKRRYNWKNRKHIAMMRRRRYLRTIEKSREYGRKYRAKNRERIRELYRNWARKNPGRVKLHNRRHYKAHRKEMYSLGLTVDGTPKLTGWELRRVRIQNAKRNLNVLTPKQKSRLMKKHIATLTPEERRARISKAHEVLEVRRAHIRKLKKILPNYKKIFV